MPWHISGYLKILHGSISNQEMSFHISGCLQIRCCYVLGKAPPNIHSTISQQIPSPFTTLVRCILHKSTPFIPLNHDFTKRELGTLNRHTLMANAQHDEKAHCVLPFKAALIAYTREPCGISRLGMFMKARGN